MGNPPGLYALPSIVVGIDGSQAAIQAALWAVDEAVDRDIPLRLCYAIDTQQRENADQERAARELASADIAIRHAAMAVEGTEKPVKIEMEIIQDAPIPALIRASRSAVMVCVGAVGFRQYQRGRVGSTAAALARTAHCPMAIIRGHRGHTGGDAGVILVDLDGPHSSDAVLEYAMEEARLRDASLQAFSCPLFGAHITRDHDQQRHAAMDRRLARVARRYPDVALDSVVVRESLVDYLATDANGVQLLVVGSRDRDELAELVGPAGNAALRRSECSVLVVARSHL